jgi:hypothetical protein
MRITTMRGIGLIVACTLTFAACGAGGAGAATAAKNKAAATRQITSAFVTIFNANDKNEKARESELQAASKYKSAFVKLFSSAVAKSNPTLAQVTKVSFPGSAVCASTVKVKECAVVTYNIDTATTGAALLTGQTGYAVLVGRKWLVSDVSFCALAKLAGESC